jgi:ribosomal protein S18 acetylase RimI-like enzyme
VGGTHIIDRAHSAAAIGNMYTHPAYRGRGHAGAVLGAIVAALQKEQITTIVLNVDQQNPTARRLYEKHGFQIHLPYVEGAVILHSV